MPWKAKRQCKVSSCPSYAEDGKQFCTVHRQAEPIVRSAKGQARQKFESGRTWQAIRRAYLSRHPLCADCERQGIIKVAEQVHHIDDDHTNNYDANLQALCIQCHTKRTFHGDIPRA